jgi:hypothetical protein
MVKGDGGKQVVGDVGVCDMVEEGIQKTKRAVHSGQGPPQPVPLIIGVVGQLGVGVLHECDEDDPARSYEVGYDVNLQVLPPIISFPSSYASTTWDYNTWYTIGIPSGERKFGIHH